MTAAESEWHELSQDERKEALFAALPAFDYNAPLPDLHIRHGRSWEPAARRYRDIEPEEKEQA